MSTSCHEGTPNNSEHITPFAMELPHDFVEPGGFNPLLAMRVREYHQELAGIAVRAIQNQRTQYETELGTATGETKEDLLAKISEIDKTLADYANKEPN